MHQCSIALVRGRLAWLSGLALAGAVGYRALAWRRRVAAQPPSGVAGDPRAEELRQRLAEARAMEAERDEVEEAETPVDRVEAMEDVERRRRSVHEHGRALADEMRPGDER
jgi:hypothetical protein